MNIFRRKDEATTSEQLDSKLPSGLEKRNESVWEFYSPEGEYDVDIIFFHGLHYSDYENAFWKTWLAKDSDQIIWPKDWLSKKFPRARIFSVSYNSSASLLKGESVKQAGDVTVIGENLVLDIILDIDVNIGQNCPVILVGHCLGGLVIKEFIIGAIKNEDSSGDDTEIERITQFLENFKGAFFYGVPSGGFPADSFDKLTSRGKGNSPILERLKTLDTERARINDQFRKHRDIWNARTFGLAEGRETSYGGFKGIVVPDASVREDVDSFYTFQEADHFTVCRARNKDDPTVIGKLSQFIRIATQQTTIQYAAAEQLT